MSKLKIFRGGIGSANIRLDQPTHHNDGEWCVAATSQKAALAAIGTWGNPFRTGHATTLEGTSLLDEQYAEMLANPGVVYVRAGANYPRPPWTVWKR